MEVQVIYQNLAIICVESVFHVWALDRLIMGCFNILFILFLGGIYLFWPDLMQVEGFWFSFIAIWLCFFVSWALFGDIADVIAGVNKYKDEEF